MVYMVYMYIVESRIALCLLQLKVQCIICIGISTPCKALQCTTCRYILYIHIVHTIYTVKDVKNRKIVRS